jgi:antitoxin component YwqK of YwqJK toxin-antitoxin module
VGDPIATSKPRRESPRALQLIVGFVMIALLGITLLRQNEKVPEPTVIEYDKAELERRDDGLYVIGSTNAFSGIMIERYKEDGLKSRSEFVDGQLHGTSEGFFPQGQRQILEHFVKGVSSGIRSRWYTNGTMQSEGLIVNGEFSGGYKRWYQSGLVAEDMLFQDGKPDGISRAWYESGSLKSLVNMKMGEVVSRETWDDGEIIQTNSTDAASSKIKK